MAEETVENLYCFIKSKSEEELYSYIRSESTDIELLREIAYAITCYQDSFDELLSTINLPQIDILLEDKSLSSKFLECLEDILCTYSYYDDGREGMSIIALEKIFEHPNTTQKMLRYACDSNLQAYVLDKLDKDDPLNRKKLKEIREDKDLNPKIREQASQILKVNSSIKPKAVAVLIELSPLMQEFRCYCTKDFQTLCDDNITGSFLQKLSLLFEEMTKLREQMGAEKLIFIPVFRKIYECYRTELDKYEPILGTGRYTWKPRWTSDKDPVRWELVWTYDYKMSPRDYVLFDEHLEFCRWLYSCIVRIANDGYIKKEGNAIIDNNIIFDTGFYSNGYIKVEKSEKYGNFNITRRYIRDEFITMNDNIVNYIDELATDYNLQVVGADVKDIEYKTTGNIGKNDLNSLYLKLPTKSFIDCLYGLDMPISVIYSDSDCPISKTDFSNENELYFNAKNPLNYTTITNDGIFLDVSDENYYVKILADGTFSVDIVEKGYNGIVQGFQALNAAQEKYKELMKQGNARFLTKK